MKFISILFLLNPLFILAQGSTDIILFDVTRESGKMILSSGKNITSHPGYDNQPFFYETDIYYSSEDSGQMDIKKYNYKTGLTSRITNTVENEFSPTVTPDKKYFSCILQRKNGKQDLVKYPLKGGAPEIIIDDLKVGYHTWAGNDHLLLFVLEDTNRFGLHHYNTKTKADKVITTDIGRSLHNIPGKDAYSFIQKSKENWMIRQYDINSGMISDIMPALPNRDLIAWGHSGEVVISDGTDIFIKRPGNNEWQKVVMKGASLKNISRLAFNKDDTKLAVVASE